MEFAERTAVVSGASQGIGRAIALALAARGARVLALARSARRLEETVALAAESAGSVRPVPCDVADGESVAAAAAGILADSGVDYLINNAGVTRDGLLMRMKETDWNAVLDTNLSGVFRLSRAFLPAMIRARFGRIVNVSSVVAQAGNPGQANYAASKGGIEGFTRSLAREVASRNVTVNAIAPGYIDTPMTAALDEPQREALLSRIPMRRLGTPEDVAGAVIFLLADGAGYITGQVLHVNGGMYM
ncbi:MAG: 3-oxoacyl-[acyl-carrier-protein] reductase [Acidobacteriota bacterium]|jgi:3-oxoacyl-[acyl-carrier protein] reductase